MVERHFTVTGFVVHQGSTLLHWHPKVKMWLPPGGHIDENEDPVQAVLREIDEETGVQAEVVPTGPVIKMDYPTQVAAPYTIMIEDIDDPVQGFHHHIDMIYFCRPASSPGPINDGWRWVSQQDLKAGSPMQNGSGESVVPPEDVRLLASRAFELIDRSQP
ncbi:MAG: NUDIX domain-containing protein [Chloroflexi bacterium]|nr:NUDIX domain-containing protein [Chloroflexota bacterium]MDA1226376.1 NUDIX domain-containing protein [Chloroflexota bacterium]